MKTTLQTLALAIGLMIVTAIPAWAGQGVGTSPYAADLLVSGLNTGQLNPGQEYWYAYSRLDLGDPAYNAVILSLNFEAEGRAIASRVNFQVFDFEQVDAWLRDSSGPVDSLGLGTPASADFDVNTGERFWAGPIQVNKVYYVRIFNLSPSPVQFRLTALGQKSAQIDAFMTMGPGGTTGQAVIPAAVTASTGTDVADSAETSLAPTTATAGSRALEVTLPLAPDDDSPASTRWLLAAQAIQGLPPNDAAVWLMSAASLGWLPLGNTPALRPTDPNANIALATSDDGGGEGPGQEAAVPVAPDPLKGDNIYPNQPVRLLNGTNTGRMSPRSEHWYTFSVGSVDDKIIENFDLTMFFTPGEPNLARDVTFELFTGDQYQIWERGTPKDMEHFGAGSWVSRDGDYDTGERLWHGTVVDGDLYFVKITNATQQWVDYHLMTGDIYNAELGPALPNGIDKARVVDNTPTGRDIGSPLTINTGLHPGRLAAGQEIWFQFERKSFKTDEFEFDPYLLELRHTPGDGYVTNHVNFEIYPFQDQAIWRRGDTDLIRPLGAGSDLAYDRASNTHTWVWDGNLVSNTTYFIRLRNDSIQEISYEFLIRGQ